MSDSYKHLKNADLKKIIAELRGKVIRDPRGRERGEGSHLRFKIPVFGSFSTGTSKEGKKGYRAFQGHMKKRLGISKKFSVMLFNVRNAPLRESFIKKAIQLSKAYPDAEHKREYGARAEEAVSREFSVGDD